MSSRKAGFLFDGIGGFGLGLAPFGWEPPECDTAGCWQSFTETDLDGLYTEALGLNWGSE